MGALASPTRSSATFLPKSCSAAAREMVAAPGALALSGCAGRIPMGCANAASMACGAMSSRPITSTATAPAPVARGSRRVVGTARRAGGAVGLAR